MGGNGGFKNDILVTDGTRLYLHHKAFDLNLADINPDNHIVASGGFLDGQPQHRTCRALAGGVLFVAGEPMRFQDPSYKN